MIKNCNDDDLNSYGVDPKFNLFYIIWKELTDQRTMDSYQYRIMNSLSILNELIESIDNRLNRFTNTNHSINDCKDEAASIISRDTVIQAHFPNVHKILLYHLHQKSDTDAELRALRHQVVYCYGIISQDYLSYLVDDLEQDINAANDKGIIEKANILVSNCSWNGWSTQALYFLIEALKNTVIYPSNWTSFKSAVSAIGADEYVVFLPLNIKYKYSRMDKVSMVERTNREIESMGICIKTGEEIQTEHKITDGLLQNAKRYMVVNVNAHDFYSACYRAIDSCSNILNIISFYNYIEAWSVRDIRCVAHNISRNATKTIKEGQLYFTYDYLDSSQKVYKASKQLLKQTSTSVGKKLNATYAYANIGKEAVSQEEQFINLWVALESLCRSDVYENIISNVLETVPPALCNRYIYRHYRNFIEDCERCGVDFTFSTRTITVLYRDRQEIVKDLLEIMRDNTLYNELLTKCQVNSLLVIRCEELHQLANNASWLFSKISGHYITVRRQLSRLYRIRNEIAHSAKAANGSLRLYIEHLTDYLSCFVSEIVMYSTSKQESNAEVIFEMIKDNYRLFVEYSSTKKGNASVLLSDLVASGIIDLL